MPKFPQLITPQPTGDPLLDNVIRDIAATIGTDAPFQATALNATNATGALPTYTAASPNAIAATLQMTNAKRAPLGAFFKARVWIAASSGGAPGGSSGGMTVTAGTQLEDHGSDKDLDILTNGNGAIGLSVAAAAAATCYLHVSIAGAVSVFKLVWT